MRSQVQEQSPWWNQSIVHWQANQVAITFHSPLDRAEGTERIIASLRLDVLNQFLAAHGFQLQSFTLKDVPHPEEPPLYELEQLEAELEQLEAEVEILERVVRNRTPFTLLSTDDNRPYKTPAQRDLEELESRIELIEREIEQRERFARQNVSTESEREGQKPSRRSLNSPVGKYLFVPSSGQGTLAMCFFHSSNPILAPTVSPYGNGKEGATTADTTKAVVKLINQNLDRLKQDGHVPLVSATPNWISGSTPPIGSACPASEPIPVPEERAHIRWHFTLSELSDTLKALNGEGVTVFLLDTMPNEAQIKQAAINIGSKNTLLQNVAAAMSSVPPSIVIPTPKTIPTWLASIETGKDIYGRHFGFNMPDHGLFVTGILHDLAPKANIECIRVLNDYGVGDLSMIAYALYEIQQRMVKQDVKHVVVNMSMIVAAPDASLPDLWFADDNTHEGLAAMIQDIELLYVGFRMVIQSLVTQGAVVVASAGNELDASNLRGMSGGVSHRFGPRYPAAFPEVISVGAVDSEGLATSYSDYPSVPPHHNGVATYGGALPQPVPSQPDPSVKTHAVVKDAVVGLYSASHFPTLSASETPPNEYTPVENSHGWAYWSGTSFATPIVSSLAALLLQAKHTGLLSTPLSVQDLITKATGQKHLTASHTSFSNHTGFGTDIGLLKAVQEGTN